MFLGSRCHRKDTARGFLHGSATVPAVLDWLTVAGRLAFRSGGDTLPVIMHEMGNLSYWQRHIEA